MTLPKAIIVDLDGTLCDHRHRLHFVENEWKSILETFGEIPLGIHEVMDEDQEGVLYRADLTEKGWINSEFIGGHLMLLPVPDITHWRKANWKPDWEAFYAAMDKDGVNEWCDFILNGCFYHALGRSRRGSYF